MIHVKRFNEANQIKVDLKDLINEDTIYINCDKYDIDCVIFNTPEKFDGGSWASCYRGGEFVLVFEDEEDATDLGLLEHGKLIAIIREYEMMNPFYFDGIIVVPGRDTITCFNVKTKKHVCKHIR